MPNLNYLVTQLRGALEEIEKRLDPDQFAGIRQQIDAIQDVVIILDQHRITGA